MLHINSITLPEEDDFARRFNENSRLFQAHQACEADESKTEQEKEAAFMAWYEDRQRLEMGM